MRKPDDHARSAVHMHANTIAANTPPTAPALAMSPRLLPILPLLLLGACTWVEPDAAGTTIRVVYDQAASAACVDLRRTVTVSVKHEIAGIERDRRKVLDELESLARNAAGRMPDADTVRATGPVGGGEQTYAIYDCR